MLLIAVPHSVQPDCPCILLYCCLYQISVPHSVRGWEAWVLNVGLVATDVPATGCQLVFNIQGVYEKLCSFPIHFNSFSFSPT